MFDDLIYYDVRIGGGRSALYRLRTDGTDHIKIHDRLNLQDYYVLGTLDDCVCISDGTRIQRDETVITLGSGTGYNTQFIGAWVFHSDEK